MISEKLMKEVNIWPNPITEGKINVALKDMEGTTIIRLVDMSGKLVSEKQVTGTRTFELNINAKQGIYLMQFINNNERIIKKVTVQ